MWATSTSPPRGNRVGMNHDGNPKRAPIVHKTATRLTRRASRRPRSCGPANRCHRSAPLDAQRGAETRAKPRLLRRLSTRIGRSLAWGSGARWPSASRRRGRARWRRLGSRSHRFRCRRPGAGAPSEPAVPPPREVVPPHLEPADRGAGGGIRTRTGRSPMPFEGIVSPLPPPRREAAILVGAPAGSPHARRARSQRSR